MSTWLEHGPVTPNEGMRNSIDDDVLTDASVELSSEGGDGMSNDGSEGTHAFASRLLHIIPDLKWPRRTKRHES